jgi:hypothetical protein
MTTVTALHCDTSRRRAGRVTDADRRTVTAVPVTVAGPGPGQCEPGRTVGRSESSHGLDVRAVTVSGPPGAALSLLTSSSS